PADGTAGSYNVTFRVQDSGGLSDSETVVITVAHLNHAPVLAAIGAKSVTDGSGTLTFTVSATDVDGGTLTYSATGLPSGASFKPAIQLQLSSCTTASMP
ncbi:MAG TPA: Ig-like domain-containing protein, partial [Candidatus Paceibacterota bacterium]|nr:Ig-like domain-containing protein [Candidatus Paceibacterota bacterium]